MRLSQKNGFFLLTAATLPLILGGWSAIYLSISDGQQVADQTGMIVAAGLMLAGSAFTLFGMMSCRRTGEAEISPRRPDQPESTPGENVEELLLVTEPLQALSLHMEEASNGVVAAATSINHAATQLATTIHAIDSSVELLNGTSQTTAAAIMQMDATLHEVEVNVRSTVAIADAALRDAEGGKVAVDEAVTGIMEIQRASAITAEVMENLSQRAADIGSILSVIDELAGRTNLLALNASIIAAQAGEHGNAFAVVAEEIKTLATKTKESTSEITLVIVGVQNETARAVKAIGQTEQSINAGVKRSRQSGESLDKIVAGMRQVADQIAMIARAASEQTHGIYDISHAMETMTNMMEQIGKAAREQTMASDSISTAITNMRAVTAQVQSATLEQSTTSSLIADSASQMLSLAHASLNICNEQKKDSNKIGQSVEEILASTDHNLDIAHSLNTMLVELQQHVITLREMANQQSGL